MLIPKIANMTTASFRKQQSPANKLHLNFKRYWVGAVLASLFNSVAWDIGTSTVNAEPPVLTKSTPLDDYIAKADDTYQWSIVDTIETPELRTTVIKLKSQTWLTTNEVDRPVWEHWLTIVSPPKPTSDRAFLLIGGGSHNSKQPTGPDGTAAAIAKATGGIVAELKNVPNQPLIFHQDGKPRVEDDLIAYAWDQFLKTENPEWLPRLPMVKSAIKAMDCVQEYMASEEGGKHTVSKFVVGGASKRGWTTWMTAPADTRVEAVIPIVIDVLNVDPSLRHHAEVYGFWAEAIGDYYQHGIMRRFDDPQLQKLHAISDPFSYRERLTMPKYIVNAVGDQFFLPDSSKFYLSELPGENLLRYVPNADHSLRNTDAPQTIGIYFSLIANQVPRPQYNWSFEADGSIRVTSKSKPAKVLLWQATNPDARDFRLEKIGPAFKSTQLEANSDGDFIAAPPPNAPGWTARFVELTYDVGGPYPLIVTTAVQISPDTKPHAGVDLSKVPYEPELSKP